MVNRQTWTTMVNINRNKTIVVSSIDIYLEIDIYRTNTHDNWEKRLTVSWARQEWILLVLTQCYWIRYNYILLYRISRLLRSIEAKTPTKNRRTCWLCLFSTRIWQLRIHYVVQAHCFLVSAGRNCIAYFFIISIGRYKSIILL